MRSGGSMSAPRRLSFSPYRRHHRHGCRQGRYVLVTGQMINSQDETVQAVHQRVLRSSTVAFEGGLRPCGSFQRGKGNGDAANRKAEGRKRVPTLMILIPYLNSRCLERQDKPGSGRICATIRCKSRVVKRAIGTRRVRGCTCT